MQSTELVIEGRGYRSERSDYEGFASPLSKTRYIRGRLLGRGAHALVYAAFDERLQRPVAIKVLRDPDAKLAARLLRESQLLARLAHPHVVQVYEIGLWKKRPAMVLEQVPGHDLRTAVNRLGGLPWQPGARILRELFEAVAHVHDQGIVHRDLKLQNVIRGSSGLRLIDFGLAEELSEPSTITEHGFVVGTPYYRPPERTAGAEATPAADVFSLGVVAYCLLTGELPFEATDEASLATVVRRFEPPTISKIPKPLWEVIERALEKDPVLRFSSAGSLHQAWEEARARSQRAIQPKG